MKKSFKQWQMDKNIMDAVACIDMFLSTRAKTIKLLQLILPIGWRLSKKENNIKWIERDFQVNESDIYNVYNSIKQNKVHIYQYFKSDFDKDLTTIRLNVIVDEYDRVQTV